MVCGQAFRAYTVDICVDDILAKEKSSGQHQRVQA